MATVFSSRLTSSLVLLFLFLSISEAKEILVGGKENAWKIPSSESDSLNNWAGNSRFRIGDSLVWKYDGGKDSVLQVTKEAYASCNTSAPVAEYKDGNTKLKLEKSGPSYFISGAKGHCEQGQKLVVVVLSPRHRYTGISPAPSPAEVEGPAVAPTSYASGLKAGLLMKRASLVDQETRARLKHQTLLQEFLDLQKEFVSKKKKLQAKNQRRDTLLAEVRFLRQRYSYLSMIKSQEYERQQHSVQSQNPHLQSIMVKPKSLIINEAGERRPSPLPDIDLNVIHEEGSGKNKGDVHGPLLKEKKLKNRLINGKRVGKKKISWQDPVALKVRNPNIMNDK
ncbi:hypothetical protein V6N11_007762 [Hibiscus sabdariffa]|uniref:Phytocyanin domain-containing protein n=1 Tax=Hibiscus sabdariffa TaxID=183260 RepID=A0ABR2NJG6_9ROSI